MTPRLLLLGALFVLAGCQQKEMTEYSAPDGNFKAKFSGEPKVTTTSANGMTLKMYLSESANRGFMIGWADMPIPPWESEAKTKERLYDGRDGALKAVNGKSNLTTKSILLADRFPGIEFGGEAEGRHIRARVYLVGKRMYQVFVMSRQEEDLTAPEAEEFLESFALLELPPGSPPPRNGVPMGTGDSPAPAPGQAAPPSPVKLDGWLAFQSPKGKFQSQFQSQPAEKTQKIGETEFVAYTSDSPEGTFTVAFADVAYPPDQPMPKTLEWLDGARNEMVKVVGGKLMWSNWYPLRAAHPGQEYAAKTGDKHLRGRVYLIGSRVYHLTVVGNRENTGKWADPFFDSFQPVE